MQITINEKEYTLRFGTKFINTLDNIYSQSMNGVEFGMGIEMMQSYIGLRRPTALMNVIKAGLSHLDTVPSNDALEDYLESVFEKGDDEKLFVQVEKSMEQAPFLKRKLKELKRTTNQEEQVIKSTKK